MKTFHIHPLNGLDKIQFGWSQDQVEEVLGKGSSVRQNRHIYLNSIYIDFSKSDRKVEFIELPISQTHRFLYEGQDVHRLPRKELIEILSEKSNNFEKLGSLVFPKLQISLWGENQSNEHLIAAIGIGEPNYFDFIQKRN